MTCINSWIFCSSCEGFILDYCVKFCMVFNELMSPMIGSVLSESVLFIRSINTWLACNKQGL